MKEKKFIILIGSMLVIILASVAVSKLTKEENKTSSNTYNIVTSFYPMYVAVENIVDNIDGVQVSNLTGNQTGCLHDYQLTTEDMKKLEKADVFVMNGGGMESYIEQILKQYPDLKIIDATEGMEFIANSNEEHHHDEEEHTDEDDHASEEEHDHEHGEYNAHVWMNPQLYRQQVQTITNKLVEYNQENKSAYEENAKNYDEKIAKIENELQQLGTPVNKEVIIFHDAFAYLAEYLGVEVAYSVEIESESSLSSGEIAHVVDEVKLHDIKALFTEKQYKETIADAVAKETNATVYSLDSLVTGDMSKDSYIKGMEANIKMLKEALY